MEITKGSVWNKWDLHLHTPETKLSDNFKSEKVWEDYINEIENSDVVAFGITDYFCCNNYFRTIELRKQFFPKSDKKLFPNVELRLDVSVNKSAEEVNLHIVFSNDDKTLAQIPKFLMLLETNITDESGRKINCQELQTHQFAAAAVTLTSISVALEKTFGKKKPYIILAASNNAGIRADSNSPRKQIISDEIDKFSDAFFGSSKNIDWFLRSDRYENKKPKSLAKPVIGGCDAHSFEDLKATLGKRFTKASEICTDITWIKGEITFEGLVQLKYEPVYRVSIAEMKPRNPIRKIEAIELNFPENTYLRKDDSNIKQEFCLQKLKKKIFFSEFFTCIIGGRGTGKSTIINLIGEKLGERTEFFKENNIIVEDNEYDISGDRNNYINIDGTTEIEFISQGKIERLAEGEELTRLIFTERIREIGGDFYTLETQIHEAENLIDKNISLFVDRDDINKSQITKVDERDSYQNVLDSINDEKYQAITSSIQSIGNQLQKLKDSNSQYIALLNRLKNIVIETPIHDEKNEVDNRIEEIINNLKALDEFNSSHDLPIQPKDFKVVNELVVELTNKLANEKNRLEEFFREKGTSEENIKDSQKAAENVGRLKIEIEGLDLKIENLERQIDNNNEVIGELPTLNKKYQKLIEQNLKILNDKLKVKNDNVLNIEFKYQFATARFEDAFFDEFYRVFGAYHMSYTQIPMVKEVLFLIEPQKALKLSFIEFIEDLETKLNTGNYRRTNNYVQIIINIFKEKSNFEIYLNLIKKHNNNYTRYIKIDGFYGGKELGSCSFGQRCTAVIVTLLMTGVKPLIIDEPEAHLDNKLIADYLVGLIKEKKQDRQIIFATHNSNFVINADAELVHILEVPDNDIFSTITSTTIENTAYKVKLLKLEGGKDAFKLRENKYAF